jgi:hypothetical protein
MFLFADGSTRVLQATDAGLIVDRDGFVDIQADMVETKPSIRGAFGFCLKENSHWSGTARPRGCGTDN